MRTIIAILAATLGLLSGAEARTRPTQGPLTQFCGTLYCAIQGPQQVQRQVRHRQRAPRVKAVRLKHYAPPEVIDAEVVPLPRPRPPEANPPAVAVNILDAFRQHVAEIVEPVRAGYVALKTSSGRRVVVAERFAWRFAGFLRDLEATGYRIADIGGYCYRRIAGTRHLSKHAFGAAVDVNQVERNVVTARFPSGISGMAARWGLKSGGDWRGTPDLGHFEVASMSTPRQRHRRVVRYAGAQ